MLGFLEASGDVLSINKTSLEHTLSHGNFTPSSRTDLRSLGERKRPRVPRTSSSDLLPPLAPPSTPPSSTATASGALSGVRTLRRRCVLPSAMLRAHSPPLVGLHRQRSISKRRPISKRTRHKKLSGAQVRRETRRPCSMRSSPASGPTAVITGWVRARSKALKDEPHSLTFVCSEAPRL